MITTNNCTEIGIINIFRVSVSTNQNALNYVAIGFYIGACFKGVLHLVRAV